MELVETMVLMQFHEGVVLAEAVTQLPVVLVFVVELGAM